MPQASFDKERLRRVADDLVGTGLSYMEILDVFREALVESAVVTFGSQIEAAARLRMSRSGIVRVIHGNKSHRKMRRVHEHA